MKRSELQSLVGLTEDQVRSHYKDMIIRILRQDDKHFIGTNNHHMDRINLYLVNSKVVKATIC